MSILGILAGLYQDLYKELIGQRDVGEIDSMVCEDEYLRLEIKSKFAGPFYNADGYDFEATITNTREVLLYVAGVQARFLSYRVIAKVDAIKDLQRGADPLYYISTFEGPGVVLPGEERLLHFRGPRFVPEEVGFQVEHSGAKSGSACQLPIAAAADAPLPFPRDLSLATDLGMDGLDALRKAASLIENDTQAPSWRVVSCIPSSHTTYMQPTGLYLHKITEWIVVFKAERDLLFVIVGDEETKVVSSSGKNEHEEPETFDMEQVRIGSGEALRVAIESNALYDNSSLGWFLAAGRRADGTTIPVWRLPYIGPSYLNILIDAEGKEILNSKEIHKQLAPVETGSHTRERRKDNSANQSGEDQSSS